MNEYQKQEINKNHTMRWHINEKYEQRQMTISWRKNESHWQETNEERKIINKIIL